MEDRRAISKPLECGLRWQAGSIRCAEIPRLLAWRRKLSSLALSDPLEHAFRLSQVVGVEAFRIPIVDRREQVAGLIGSSLLVP
jgi:hypothetical protein